MARFCHSRAELSGVNDPLFSKQPFKKYRQIILNCRSSFVRDESGCINHSVRSDRDGFILQSDCD